MGGNLIEGDREWGKMIFCQPTLGGKGQFRVGLEPRGRGTLIIYTLRQAAARAAGGAHGYGWSVGFNALSIPTRQPTLLYPGGWLGCDKKVGGSGRGKVEKNVDE